MNNGNCVVFSKWHGDFTPEATDNGLVAASTHSDRLKGRRCLSCGMLLRLLEMQEVVQQEIISC